MSPDTGVRPDGVDGSDTHEGADGVDGSDTHAGADGVDGSDTSEPPVEVTYCPTIVDCIMACEHDTTCAAACAVTTEEGAAEQAAATALLSCTQEQCSDAADGAAFAICTNDKCQDAMLTCVAGPTPGVGLCSRIQGCLRQCPDGGSDACHRACLAQASRPAQAAFFDLQACTASHCMTADDADACLQQVIGAEGPCAGTFAACQGPLVGN